MQRSKGRTNTVRQAELPLFELEALCRSGLLVPLPKAAGGNSGVGGQEFLITQG